MRTKSLVTIRATKGGKVVPGEKLLADKQMSTNSV
jgi:hypothetical protein